MAELGEPLGAGTRLRRPAWRSRLGGTAWLLGSAMIAIGGWALIILIVKPAPYVLPAPWDVLKRSWTDAGPLASHGAMTLSEILVGLVFGVAAALPLGIAIVAVPFVRRLVYPIVIAFNAIPKVALAPLFVVWFGYGYLPRVLITGSIAFFPVLVSTVSGLMAIDPELLQLAKVVRAKEAQVFLRMRMPYALPSIFSGIKVATSLAVIGSIIAEFVASDKGWGYLLVQASGSLDTTIMFAIIILLAIVASGLFYLVAVAERLFVSWHASQRQS